MAKSIISEGKTSNEAIEKGLKELGCKLEDVNVKVLEDGGKKAFFSILDPRVVKVELTIKEGVSKKFNTSVPASEERKVASEEDVKKCTESIESFLNDFAKVYGEIEFKIEEKDNDLFIVISGNNCPILLLPLSWKVIRSFSCMCIMYF